MSYEENESTPVAVEAPRKKGRARWMWWALGLLVVGAVLWRGLFVKTGNGASKERAARAIAVLVTPAAKRDVPIELDGLGSVVPLTTVTLKSRVEGRLEQLFFKEGQAVKKGDVLAQVDPRPFRIQLAQAQATLAKDTAQLKNAKLNLERYQSLQQQQLVPQQQVDDQKTLVDQAEAAVALDQAQVDSARLSLEWTKVTSPVDGVTGVRQVDAGNLVHVNDPNGLVVITQLDPIAVLFTLPQDVLPQVSEAMETGPLPVSAYARDGSTLLGSGTLMLIDNQINASTATLRLKAQLPNPRRQLWPNQFVKTRLHLTTRKDALVVPTVAVQRGPKGVFVYTVKSDGTAEMKPITVESVEGDLTLVKQGLAEGDRVVVDGQNQLRPGAKVTVKSAEGGGTESRAQVSP
jgi:multidrug efflux system membrane fusion protein